MRWWKAINLCYAMDKKSENRASKHKELLGFLEANDVVLATIPGYPASFAKYKLLNQSLQERINKQQVSIKAFTLDKEQKHLVLVEAVVDEAAKLGFLAEDTNNPLLMVHARVKQSTLRKQRDMLLIASATNLHGHLSANEAALASYGVTAASLVNFQGKIDAFSEVIDEKSLAFVERVAATAAIGERLSELDVVAKRLGQMIRSLHNEELNGRLVTASKVRNLGIRHYNLVGTVVDEEDKLAVHNAQVTVYGPKGKITTALTNELGYYRFLSLTPGEYKAVVEKSGFFEYVVTFEILPKQKTVRDVELEVDNSGGEDDEAAVETPSA